MMSTYGNTNLKKEAVGGDAKSPSGKKAKGVKVADMPKGKKSSSKDTPKGTVAKCGSKPTSRMKCPECQNMMKDGVCPACGYKTGD